ncbi:Extracellular exo-alpha-(1-_5)-L-arabinofuranosidase [Paramyrothecium foliicola]|nr:Extracellular exo-alpha-(1->5)-L-arabinofuranosidase [Paramyrothecium foliicola]
MWSFSQVLPVTACLLSVAHAFTNPVKTLNGSDPQMIYYEGKYYLTATSWTTVELTVASSIEGLKKAIPTVIYDDRSDPLRTRNWWAPEMWRIDGRWYVYFSTSINGTWDEMLPSLTQWVLEGGTEGPLDDPFVLKGKIRPNNYHGGMLDGTVYNIDGKNYFIFSSVASEDESPNGASLWISELLTPTTLGPATMIAYPDYDWEQEVSAVLEGAAGITSPSGEVWMVYSADSCNGPEYKLGAMKLTTGADPLLPSSWTKLPEPILVTTPENGIYGPGHNGFFKSPDGTQDWTVFHANRDENGSCDKFRQTFVQQVAWGEDGAPRLAPPLPAGVEIDEPSAKTCRRRRVF